MGTRRPFTATVTILALQLVPTLCFAGHHNFSVFVAPSASLNPDPPPSGGSPGSAGGVAAPTLFVDNGGGVHVNGEITFKPRGEHDPNARKMFSLIGDLSIHLVGRGDDDATQMTLMFGPRFAFPDFWKAHTFVHAMLIGATHISETQQNLNATSYAIAFGAGVDIMPATHRKKDEKGNKRLVEGRQGFRVQADRIVPINGNMGKSWRISAGYVYWFLDEDHDCDCTPTRAPKSAERRPSPPSN